MFHCQCHFSVLVCFFLSLHLTCYPVEAGLSFTTSFAYTTCFLEVQRAYNIGTTPMWICRVHQQDIIPKPKWISHSYIIWKCTSTATQMKHTTIALHTNGISSYESTSSLVMILWVSKKKEPMTSLIHLYFLYLQVIIFLRKLNV